MKVFFMLLARGFGKQRPLEMSQRWHSLSHSYTKADLWVIWKQSCLITNKCFVVIVSFCFCVVWLCSHSFYFLAHLCENSIPNSCKTHTSRLFDYKSTRFYKGWVLPHTPLLLTLQLHLSASPLNGTQIWDGWAFRIQASVLLRLSELSSYGFQWKADV